MAKQILSLLVYAGLVWLAACAEPPPTVQPETLELVEHGRMPVSAVMPLQVTMEETNAPAPGWYVHHETMPVEGFLVVGPADEVFFTGLTSPTPEAMENQLVRDFRNMDEYALGLGPIFEESYSLLSLETRQVRTTEGHAAFVRRVDLSLPLAAQSTPKAYARFFLGALHGAPVTTATLEEGASSRFTGVYLVMPMVDATGRHVQTQGKPAVMRMLLLAPATRAEATQWLTQEMFPYMFGAFVGMRPLDMQRRSFTWTIENRERQAGMVFVLDSSRSVVRSEFDMFVASAKNQVQSLADAGFSPRVALARGCDGQLARPLATSSAFADGLEESLRLLEERSEALLQDEDCVNGAYQGILALERLAAAPPPDLEDSVARILVMYTDGDDQSRPVSCQDCLKETSLQENRDLLAASGWRTMAVAPQGQCVFEDLNAIGAASRLVDLSFEENAEFVNVCLRDWQNDVLLTQDSLLGEQNLYRIDPPPLNYELDLRLAGVPLSADPVSGYTFQPESSAFIFGNKVALQPGEKIQADAWVLAHP